MTLPSNETNNATTPETPLHSQYVSVFNSSLDTTLARASSEGDSTDCDDSAVNSHDDGASKQGVNGTNPGVDRLQSDQGHADLLSPDVTVLRQMNTVRSALPSKIIALLGDVSYDTRRSDLERWLRMLRMAPLKVLKPLAKEMVYHIRSGSKKTISVHGKKEAIVKRFITYGHKYADQKKPATSTMLDPLRSSENVTLEIAPSEVGAFVTDPESENTTLLETNQSASRSRRQTGSDSRRLAELEAQEAATNSTFIGALSANEICRALHALCEPESLSAARKVFQDSTRLELDASCSQGLSPVDSGWTFIASLYNDSNYKPINIRSIDVELEHLNPSTIEVPRGPESLKTAMSALRSSYQEAERKYFKSGNNDAEFFSYCNGNSVLVYCHQLLKNAPHIKEAFPRSLPQNVGVTTGGDAPLPDRPRRGRQTDDDGEPSLREPCRKKRNTVKNEISMALRDHTQSLVNMKKSQFEKSVELKEKYLALRETAIDEQTTGLQQQAELAKVKKNQEVGAALCALNQSAKDISCQIVEIKNSIANNSLSNASRKHEEERLGTLQRSYDRVNKLIADTAGSTF